MNPRTERYLWLFGATIAAACALGVVLVPAPGKLKELQTELDDARGKLAVDQRSGTTFESLQRAQEGLNTKAATLDTLLATRTSAVGFLADLETLGKPFGVAVTPVFSTEPTPAVQAVPFTVTVSGPLDGVLRYVEALTSRSPVVVVDAVELTGSATVQLTLHAEVAWH